MGKKEITHHEHLYPEHMLVRYLKRGLFVGFLGGFGVGGLLMAALYTDLFSPNFHSHPDNPDRHRQVQKMQITENLIP